MTKWQYWILAIFGPAFAIMLAMMLLEPDNGIPEPFWNIGIRYLASSVMISVPQIAWTLAYLPELEPKENYWGGLIAVQIWLLVYGAWAIIEVRQDPGGDDVWFLYFLPCILLLPFGAFCGSLVRKISDQRG